jgi:methionyl-tRNA formyltransferase
MYMVEKLDAGDILTQTEVQIEEHDHTGSLHDKLSAAGADLLAETIPMLAESRIQGIPQDEEKVTYAWNITREQEKIEWDQDGTVIYNQIRGLHPWPVAYTTLNGKVMKIWWGEKRKINDQQAPGTVTAIEHDGFYVATGSDTSIFVTEVQPAGKKRMPASDYLKGAELKEGMKLGE